MQKFCLHVLLILISTYPALAGGGQSTDAMDFVQNRGQWDRKAQYRAEVPGGAVFFSTEGFRYSYYNRWDLKLARAARDSVSAKPLADERIIHWHSYGMSLKGSNQGTQLEPAGRRSHHYSYILGRDSSTWAGESPAFASVRYKSVYDGIDLIVYSQGAALKYDFELQPGAESRKIQLQFDGVTPKLATNGDLVIKTSVNEIRESAPYAYQIVNGEKKQVPCRYALKNGTVSFAFDKGYDHNKPLVIDPVIVFVTYSGSYNDNVG